MITVVSRGTRRRRAGSRRRGRPRPRSRTACERPREPSMTLLDRDVRLPDRGGRQAIPRHAGAAGRAVRQSARRADRAGRGGDRAHPPGHAVSRRRHGRGRRSAAAAPSANSRWDNTVAILTGDFLFARASQILADLGAGGDQDPGGDVRPAGERPDRRDRRAAARARIRSTTTWACVTDKTASLIATAGQFGAHVLRRAGRGGGPGSAGPARRWGVAFQLSDDILDVASESAQSGKTPGTDLREGVRTLPMLHALRLGADRRRPAGGAAEHAAT